ncbi:membrane protein [Pectobacterium betavasculorum]|uniref:Membrane protein n=1 Tax=Pectobacterium betavasculorum TaxID=55207 RepID=A0A093RF64_9GAMM|nr:YdgH/BhsA/McbA-like domain containing protein [Pectobacterium betavasculorum]KFW99063.1 membrane protein [Pectobacterium betavasculorum]
MKNVKTIAAAAVLATMTFGASAAEYVSPSQAQNLEKAGVVTATAQDLSSLQAQLAAKAEKAGAKAYTITSATGNDRLRGSAVIFN